MRNSLLATVAAAALVAGTVMVSAQGTGGGGMGGGAPGAGSGAGSPPSAAPPPSTAPAEKMDNRGGARSEQPSGRSEQPSGQRAQQPKGSTTGQGAQDRGPAAQSPSGTERGQSPSGTERGQTGQQMNRDQAPPRAGQGEGQRGSPSTTTQQRDSAQGSTSGSASLNTEQRTKIRETVIKGGNVNRVNNVNFNISVGTAVPRSVHLVTVPSTIVEIHPAWRGYLYFVVNDEIIIVEPGTLRIVAVIT